MLTDLMSFLKGLSISSKVRHGMDFLLAEHLDIDGKITWEEIKSIKCKSGDESKYKRATRVPSLMSKTEIIPSLLNVLKLEVYQWGRTNKDGV